MNITTKLSANAWSDYLAARRNAIITFHEEGLSFVQIASTLNLADGAHAERIWSARDVYVPAGERKPQPGDKTWTLWIASALGCYLQMDVDDKRLEAMAGIIERRLWALQKDAEQVAAPKSYQQTLDDLHNLLYSAQVYAEVSSAAVPYIAQARIILSKLRAAKPVDEAKPNRWGEEGVDLVARGMTWNDTEALMKEACAQAGIKWGENDEPSSLAINVMQRLANAAHKVGFTLGIERMRAAKTPAAEERAIRELLCIAYAGALAYMDDGEAQDNSVNPGIDFIRDSAAEINRKMRERAAARVEIHKANWDKPANG